MIDPASIDAFAQQFLDSGRPLDILINNAGIMAPPLVRDKRGYESQFATNHLGHFQLSLRLWPALKQAGSARVVSVSSTGVRFGALILTIFILNSRNTINGRHTASPNRLMRFCSGPGQTGACPRSPRLLRPSRQNYDRFGSFYVR